MRDKRKDVAVLVMSCDWYYDTWDGFLTLFHKFYERNDLDIILCKDEGPNDSYADKVGFDRVIKTKQTIEWSGRLKHALQVIDYEYVILLLDDFWLNRELNVNVLDEDISFIKKHQEVGVVYLCHGNVIKLKKYNQRYGVFEYGDMYRANTLPAIWKKQVLFDLAKSNETIWQFERLGTLRSPENVLFLATKESYFPFVSAIDVRCWDKKAFKLSKMYGFEIPGNRKKKSVGLRIKLFLRGMIFNIAPRTITRIRQKSIT